MLSLREVYGFLITKELIFGFKILDLKHNFSASLKYFINSLVNVTKVQYQVGNSIYLFIYLFI